MTRRIAFLRTIAVGTMIVALGGAALGADSLVNFANSDAARSDTGSSAAEHATLNVDLPAAAASVMEAFAGGSNPSTMVADRGAVNEHANANAKTRTAQSETATQAVNNVSSGQQVGQTGTSGTRPGFGCGDKNHAHSGPPGRPGATLPPGCAKQ